MGSNFSDHSSLQSYPPADYPDGWFNEIDLDASTVPPDSPESHTGADGTIILSSDDDASNDVEEGEIRSGDSDDSVEDGEIFTTNDMDESVAVIPDDDNDLVVLVPADEDDAGASDEDEPVSVDDYGDEPDDWSDDYNDAQDDFDDYEDGFDRDDDVYDY